MFFFRAVALALWFSFIIECLGHTQFGLEERAYTCTVAANGDGSDDTQNILDAFEECNKSGRTIIFSKDTTYYVNQVMNTTSLNNVTIDIYGGNNLKVNGHGTGTINGNGQTWYNLVKGISNYPNRPMGLTIWGAKDSVFSGLTFLQSQMWTMAIIHSENILLENFNVSSRTNNGYPARNTDGADLLFSNNVTFRGWTVNNGDDSISLKANSTNVLVEDCYFERGLGLALGSIGQYVDQFETIENVTARNIRSNNTLHTVYFKTWTGEQVGYPPNGGGGGLGLASQAIDGWEATYLRDAAVLITQCTTFSGTAGDCNSSKFQLKDITVKNVSGSSASSYVANLQCSEDSGGCIDIEIDDVDLVDTGTGDDVAGYKCKNIVDPIGFDC
ncbi:hypothetical protein TruAng_008052 [Truncatella angustata]|nr:hypothetical protein TruAng_008052 [Truncatella angustata]